MIIFKSEFHFYKYNFIKLYYYSVNRGKWFDANEHDYLSKRLRFVNNFLFVFDAIAFKRRKVYNNRTFRMLMELNK